MGVKKGRSLKRMSREGLILLIRELTAENESLREELSRPEIKEGRVTPQTDEASLREEIRGLRAGMEAMLRRLEGGEDVLPAGQSEPSGEDEAAP